MDCLCVSAYSFFSGYSIIYIQVGASSVSTHILSSLSNRHDEENFFILAFQSVRRHWHLLHIKQGFAQPLFISRAMLSQRSSRDKLNLQLPVLRQLDALYDDLAFDLELDGVLNLFGELFVIRRRSSLKQRIKYQGLFVISTC